MRQRLSWRGVNLLLLCVTAVSIGVEGHLVAFAPLQLQELGLADNDLAVWTGLLYAITMAASLPFGPFWGVLAERYSRRAIILRSNLLLAAAVLVAAWAPDLTWLVVSRLLMGFSFGTGGVIVATQVMLTPGLHVGRAIAVVQAAQPIAGSIGPPLGALVIPYLGVRGLYQADAVLLLGAAATLALLLPEPLGGQKPASVLGRTAEVLRLVWADRQIRWSLLNQALSRGAIAAVDSFLPVRIVQIAADPAPAIGWILGSYGALTTLATWLLSRIADRLDVIRVYTLSMLLGMALAAAIAIAPWLWLVATIAVARAIPTAFSRPLLFLHLARVVPTQQQTAVFALLPTAGNLGGLVLPLATSAIATYGVGAALMVGSVGHALSAAAGLHLRRLP